MKMTRRDFAEKVGGLGAGSILGMATCSSHGADKDGAEALSEKRKTDGNKLRRLGRTNLWLSMVGFGAQHTQDPDLIRYALDRGINHIETSWLYGTGGPRNSCKIIGKAIAGRWDSVYLAVAYEAMVPPGNKFWLPNQFEQTLRDLGTDHIDIFLWHQPGEQASDPKPTLKESQAVVAAGERVNLMLKWKAEGKIQWCGLTTHSEQMEWLKFAVTCGIYDVAVVAFNYNSPKKIADPPKSLRAKELD
jgi:aryl-alcohol dehydrogenase-like predicted oxidoreductase